MFFLFRFLLHFWLSFYELVLAVNLPTATTLRDESKFRKQKVSQDRKFAKFRGFKFREFYFLYKIYE